MVDSIHMDIKLYNTLTRKLETFVPLEPGKVRMYVCGPTVYDKAHVGHAMSILVFDIIRRYLQYRGYEVKFVMNFTDVDDKIINRAKQLGVDPFELAEGYIHEFKQHLKDLNILPPTAMPRVTQTIDQIIKMVQGLINKSYAYVTPNGDVYFRATKYKDYGKLSKRKLKEMQVGPHIETNEQKENQIDFALWKAAKPGEPSWDSPWGKGRPGWHIECSAMNLDILGEQIDIHGGGNDLIFPHHENEIAQSESFTGLPFARYWMHNGMLQMNNEKMSKSLGNFITIEEFLSKHDGDVMRMLVLNGNYRSPLIFTQKAIESAEKRLERLKSALQPGLKSHSKISFKTVSALNSIAKKSQEKFLASMNNDFNTAGALAALFELVKIINAARNNAGNKELKTAQNTLRELTNVLGLKIAQTPSTFIPLSDLPEKIQSLIEQRENMRQQKNFKKADQIRKKIELAGYSIEDTPSGPRIKKI